jgi:septal ring factor EnvC (AmiA/AmiB activator)
LTDSLHVASEQLEYRQALMKKRLRIMYKVGRSYRSNDLMGMLQLAGSSRSVADLVHRVRYAQEINRYDRRLMATIESLRDDIEQRAIALEERREMLFALKMEKEQEQSTLLSQTTERRKMLDEVQAEKEAYESMVAELEQAQKQLNILITTLEKKRKDAKKEWERGRTIAFEKRKGELPWPVSGKVVRDFGKIVHPVYKTVTMSLGIDIAATNGDMVTCVAPGKVDYVGWMRGYGKFVIVNHFNDYLTIYAHLGEISVEQEQELEFGAIVGKVGETGSLSGPKLHFQIRKSTEALDPTGWLQKL